MSYVNDRAASQSVINRGVPVPDQAPPRRPRVSPAQRQCFSRLDFDHRAILGDGHYGPSIELLCTGQDALCGHLKVAGR